MSDYVDRIAKLDELRRSGAITQDEFDAQKKTLLSNGAGAVSAHVGSASDKSKTTALILALFLGLIGVHNFYLGRTGAGIGQFFTAGGFGIWTIIDIISIASGKMRDGQGHLVTAS